VIPGNVYEDPVSGWYRIFHFYSLKIRTEISAVFLRNVALKKYLSKKIMGLGSVVKFYQFFRRSFTSSSFGSGAIRIRNDFFRIRIHNTGLRMQMLVRIQENYSDTSGSHYLVQLFIYCFDSLYEVSHHTAIHKLFRFSLRSFSSYCYSSTISILLFSLKVLHPQYRFFVKFPGFLAFLGGRYEELFLVAKREHPRLLGG
jgi:hypothetical protein